MILSWDPNPSPFCMCLVRGGPPVGARDSSFTYGSESSVWRKGFAASTFVTATLRLCLWSGEECLQLILWEKEFDILKNTYYLFYHWFATWPWGTPGWKPLWLINSWCLSNAESAWSCLHHFIFLTHFIEIFIYIYNVTYIYISMVENKFYYCFPQ